MEVTIMSRISRSLLSLSRKNLLVALSGFVAGALAAGLMVYVVMPGMMLVTEESSKDLEETVTSITKKAEDLGWVVPQVVNMKNSLEKQGFDFDHEVRIVKICKPDYAKSVLESDRFVSCLMPCSMAVWESDDGKVYITKMNTGMMGRMFGGNIARVMGDYVSKDEKAMLADALR